MTYVSDMKTTRLQLNGNSPANDPQTFEAMVAGYVAAPSLAGWNRVARRIIPGTFHTLWKAWTTVDGGAPERLVDGVFRVFPDGYTLRRAVKAVADNEVIAGLGSPRMATVPRAIASEEKS